MLNSGVSLLFYLVLYQIIKVRQAKTTQLCWKFTTYIVIIIGQPKIHKAKVKLSGFPQKRVKFQNLRSKADIIYMKKNIFHNIAPVIGVCLFALALWLIHHQLRNYHYHDIVRQIRQVPYHRLFLALFFASFSYFVLTGYDFLALRYIRQPLAYGKVAMASFIGYAFSYNATVVGGSAAKYRIYSSWGITALDIGKVVAFCAMTFWLGFLSVGGFVFLIQPLNIPAFVHLPFTTVRPLGVIFLAIVAVYLIFNILKKQSKLTVRGVEFSLPGPKATVTQILIGSLDWTVAGTVLYVLLPSSPDLLYPQFLGVFLFAQVAGFVSYVPGGLGVFDTIILLFLSPIYSTPAVIGYLLVYRVIYYILPLAVASILLTIKEALEKKHIIKLAGAAVGRWVSALVPQVLAFTTFIGGAILLFSGAVPAVRGRLFWLRDFVPLPVIEVSHFIGSLIGVALLILARGLQRRLDAAYQLTIALLGAGIVLSLLKGLDYEEAIILTIMLAVLLPCRGEFYRKVSLFRQRFTLPWVVAIIIVLLCSAWLGFFSYKHIEYSSELWWKFAFAGDAPRFLRATVGAMVLALTFGLVTLLRTSAPSSQIPVENALKNAEAIVAKSKKIYANLALLGDKSFLFSDSGSAMIMYAVEGRSWVAMGDPLGPEDQWDDLIWQFREICDRHNGWSVFYEVDKENLHYYVDLGLTFLKFGEEAIVPLESFSLEGGENRNFRYLIKKIESTGCKFEVVEKNDVPNIFTELKSVSDAWLTEKTTKEKGFSLGFFNKRYIERFPVAVVQQEGKIIAFANILEGADKEELSVDLMRYLPHVPEEGVMEYLFLQIMLRGKEQGYKSFNFGMAPLSGLEDRPAARMWNRFGTYLFQHGEHFYNFRGLRQYKEKFHPQWRPKYIVCPSGLALPHVLINIASLVSGGLKGAVMK